MIDPGSDAGRSFSLVLIALMQGVTYQEDDAPRWQALLGLQARVREYVTVLGLELILDEAEGFAYLRQRDAGEGDDGLPRLIPRRQLSYPASLLLALLRKRLADFDARAGETRLVMSRVEIVELVRLFLPDTANEAKLMDRIEGYINRIADMGFLRRLRGHEDQYEVRRILKAFVDAQWLQEFERRLAGYRSHASHGTTEEKGVAP